MPRNNTHTGHRFALTRRLYALSSLAMPGTKQRTMALGGGYGVYSALGQQLRF